MVVPASNDPHIAQIALNGIGGSTLFYDLKFNNGLSFKFSGPHGRDVLVTYE